MDNRTAWQMYPDCYIMGMEGWMEETSRSDVDKKAHHREHGRLRFYHDRMLFAPDHGGLQIEIPYREVKILEAGGGGVIKMMAGMGICSCVFLAVLQNLMAHIPVWMARTLIFGCFLGFVGVIMGVSHHFGPVGKIIIRVSRENCKNTYLFKTDLIADCNLLRYIVLTRPRRMVRNVRNEREDCAKCPVIYETDCRKEKSYETLRFYEDRLVFGKYVEDQGATIYYDEIKDVKEDAESTRGRLIFALIADILALIYIFGDPFRGILIFAVISREVVVLSRRMNCVEIWVQSLQGWKRLRFKNKNDRRIAGKIIWRKTEPTKLINRIDAIKARERILRWTARKLHK
ncbi:MAG: hypothetical protein K2K74_03950 [Lachnospiraceae bacterium]|nr:hypothetical protein [Lachnospiraceae bacterium]